MSRINRGSPLKKIRRLIQAFPIGQQEPEPYGHLAFAQRWMLLQVAARGELYLGGRPCTLGIALRILVVELHFSDIRPWDGERNEFIEPFHLHRS